jgi:hypothetical protein
MQQSCKQASCNQTVTRHKWTADDIGFLRRHAAEGAERLSRRLGVSESAVKTAASRRGISLSRRISATPLCVECRNAPIYAASREAAARELCEVCYRRYRIAEAEEDILLLKLRKNDRSLSAQKSTGRSA